MGLQLHVGLAFGEDGRNPWGTSIGKRQAVGRENQGFSLEVQQADPHRGARRRAVIRKKRRQVLLPAHRVAQRVGDQGGGGEAGEIPVDGIQDGGDLGSTYVGVAFQLHLETLRHEIRDDQVGDGAGQGHDAQR